MLSKLYIFEYSLGELYKLEAQSKNIFLRDSDGKINFFSKVEIQIGSICFYLGIHIIDQNTMCLHKVLYRDTIIYLDSRFYSFSKIL